jgi:hypothetical protein
VLFNSPNDAWRTIEKKTSDPYHPAILLKELLSWTHANLNISWKETEIKYWHIWDRDRVVGANDLRDPRDGDRFAV